MTIGVTMSYKPGDIIEQFEGIAILNGGSMDLDEFFPNEEAAFSWLDTYHEVSKENMEAEGFSLQKVTITVTAFKED